MTQDQLLAFLSAVQADTSLSDKLKAAADKDAVVAVAKEAGFEISINELTLSLSEVSEEELEAGIGYFTAVSCRATKYLSSCEGTITV